MNLIQFNYKDTKASCCVVFTMCQFQHRATFLPAYRKLFLSCRSLHNVLQYCYQIRPDSMKLFKQHFNPSKNKTNECCLLLTACYLWYYYGEFIVHLVMLHLLSVFTLFLPQIIRKIDPYLSTRWMYQYFLHLNTNLSITISFDSAQLTPNHLA